MVVMRSISVTVAGLPPVKNEAKSMLAAGHIHVQRVRDLLKGVQEASWDEPELPFPHQSLGLEMVLTGPTPPPSDATNYLGGVADVLEDKARRGDLTHLGPLAAVAVYENDRQLHEVGYRWITRTVGATSYECGTVDHPQAARTRLAYGSQWPAMPQDWGD